MGLDEVRIGWWLDRLVVEAQAAKAAHTTAPPLALTHIGNALEAIADLLGELKKPEEETLALNLRNAVYDISNSWEGDINGR